MKNKSFFIPINPYPKRTGKFSIRSGRPIFFKNKKTKDFENQVRDYLKVFLNGFRPIEKKNPVKMDVVFYIERPKSVTRENHTVKPDIDNLCKSLMDSLEGIVFELDQQVNDLTLKKLYSDEENPTGIFVELFY